MKREGVPTLERSLSFDFCDYGATINDYRADFNDFLTTIDFRVTFRLSGDYRLCDYQRL